MTSLWSLGLIGLRSRVLRLFSPFFGIAFTALSPSHFFYPKLIEECGKTPLNVNSLKNWPLTLDFIFAGDLALFSTSCKNPTFSNNDNQDVKTPLVPSTTRFLWLLMSLWATVINEKVENHELGCKVYGSIDMFGSNLGHNFWHYPSCWSTVKAPVGL